MITGKGFRLVVGIALLALNLLSPQYSAAQDTQNSLPGRIRAPDRGSDRERSQIMEYVNRIWGAAGNPVAADTTRCFMATYTIEVFRSYRNILQRYVDPNTGMVPETNKDKAKAASYAVLQDAQASGRTVQSSRDDQEACARGDARAKSLAEQAIACRGKTTPNCWRPMNK
jgi:hypothetical protein